MLAELSSALCLCINETYTRGFPGGALRICDRRRRIPVRADTQQAAFDARLIENYNAFILGPSGSGKSFFTNWYVRNCFDAGQHVFIIDKGGSYEALCALVREETGGRDGVYRTWTREHPFTFSPLEGCRGWAAEGGDPAGLAVFTVIRQVPAFASFVIEGAGTEALANRLSELGGRAVRTVGEAVRTIK